MSDTPRTDAECYSCTDTCSEWNGEWVPLEFARQLERELKEAKIGAARYEYLRKLNPREFTALTLFCVTADVHFDTEVDRRRNQS